MYADAELHAQFKKRGQARAYIARMTRGGESVRDDAPVLRHRLEAEAERLAFAHAYPGAE